MSIPNSRQFHIHPDAITEGVVTVKVGELYKQMTSVLRLNKGDRVRFFDGVGNVSEGSIAHIGKAGIIVPIETQTVQPRGRDITLAIGILKNDRMRWVLEKATELGAWSIVPMITERVIKRPDVVPPRWHHIVREAAEQSGRAWLPVVDHVQSLEQVLEGRAGSVMCAINGTSKLNELHTNGPTTIFVGPEGGFTDQEVDHAESKGALIASLGNHQLRADTAAIVALSQL